MAVKAEQCVKAVQVKFTVWMSVCQRACSVTSRALDIPRDKVFGVMFSRRGEGTCLGTANRTAQSHTRCAHPHTHFFADKILTALVQWCGTATRTQPHAR